MVFGVSNVPRFYAKLTQSGFSKNLETGESVLPPSTFGPASRANAELRIQKLMDRGKETFFRNVKQKRKQGDHTVETKSHDRRYFRRPRKEQAPYSFELKICLTTNNEKVVTLPEVTLDKTDAAIILHQINLLLEIFGECHVFTENLAEIIQTEVKHLNWEVLPPGNNPWETIKSKIQPTLERRQKGTQAIVERRLETINNYNPDFFAFGRAGFQGYIVFGFTKRKLYLLESIYFGNATYILGEQWQEISKLTKAEVLNEKLHKSRIIHQADWYKEIHKLLS
jgi:hypothetical protein